MSNTYIHITLTALALLLTAAGLARNNRNYALYAAIFAILAVAWRP